MFKKVLGKDFPTALSNYMHTAMCHFTVSRSKESLFHIIKILDPFHGLKTLDPRPSVDMVRTLRPIFSQFLPLCCMTMTMLSLYLNFYRTC